MARSSGRDLVGAISRDLTDNIVLSTLSHEEKGILLELVFRLHKLPDPTEGFPDNNDLVSQFLRIDPARWIDLKEKLTSLDCGVLAIIDDRLVCTWLGKPKRRPAGVKDTYPASEWMAQFESVFWANVWKKEGKQNAKKAWMRLKPSNSDAADTLLRIIMTGVTRYKQFLQANPTRNPKHPEGWLNGRRWEDEYCAEDLRGGNEHANAAHRDPISAGDRQRQAAEAWLAGRDTSGCSTPSDHPDAGVVIEGSFEREPRTRSAPTEHEFRVAEPSF